jgi:hypothetical protein
MLLYCTREAELKNSEKDTGMHFLGTKNPWSFSYGFNMMVDFCIWVLETDGLRVTPFDQHPEGDSSLRTAGLDAGSWLSWLVHVVNLQYQQDQAFQHGPRNGPFTHEDWQSVLIPAAQNPPDAWTGNDAVKNRLAELWKQYGPISNERQHHVMQLARKWRRAETTGSKRLYDELKPYHTRIPTLIIHQVSYAQPVDLLIPPLSAIMTTTKSQPDAAEFRERVLDIAAGLTADSSEKGRNQSQYSIVPTSISNLPTLSYKTYPLKPLPDTPPRTRVHIIAENEAKQVILDKLGDERSHFGDIDIATVQFLKEKIIPGWQMHYVSCQEVEEGKKNLVIMLRQQADGSWTLSSISTGGNIQEMATQLMAPAYDHPLVILSYGKGEHTQRDGTAQNEFVAHGEVIDNGFHITRVRLVNDAGQVFEDTVEDGLVLFAARQTQEVQWPMQAELYNREGKLVWHQTVFDGRPPFYPSF